MGKLETRIARLEARAGHPPCANPEHERAVFFFLGNDDAPLEAEIKSIRECQACSGKPIIRILGREAPRKSIGINITFGILEGHNEKH